MRSISAVAAIVCSLLTAGDVPLWAQQQPSERTPEQTIAALQYQWQVLFAAAIMNGRDHGQDPTQVGTGIGRWVARRWGPDLEPSFARDMASRLRSMGFQTEVVEESKTSVTFKWTGPDQKVFDQRYKEWGLSVTEFQAALTAWMTEMARQGGLIWNQRTDGNWLVATVTRRK